MPQWSLSTGNKVLSLYSGNIFRQPQKIKENQSYPPPPPTHTKANWDVLTVSSRFSKCVCVCVCVCWGLFGQKQQLNPNECLWTLLSP